MERFILVVDDEAIVKDMIVSFLTRSGHKVVTASNGNEAIKVIKIDYQNIGLVFTDYNMLQGDGADVIKFIKANYPEIPIILLSADDSVKVAADNLGVEFVSKPIKSFDALKELLARLLWKL